MELKLIKKINACSITIIFILLTQGCGIQNKEINIIDYKTIKRVELLGFGDCTKYQDFFKNIDDPELIVNAGINDSKETVIILNPKDYYGRVYTRNNCEELIKNKKTGQLLNGKYKIICLPILKQYDNGRVGVNLNKIDFVFAEFRNGKREGRWYYYLPEFLYPNIEITENLTQKKAFPIKAVKEEEYKNGFPCGKWILREDKINTFFIYKNGVFIKEYSTKN